MKITVDPASAGVLKSTINQSVHVFHLLFSTI